MIPCSRMSRKLGWRESGKQARAVLRSSGYVFFSDLTQTSKVVEVWESN